MFTFEAILAVVKNLPWRAIGRVTLVLAVIGVLAYPWIAKAKAIDRRDEAIAAARVSAAAATLADARAERWRSAAEECSAGTDAAAAAAAAYSEGLAAGRASRQPELDDLATRAASAEAAIRQTVDSSSTLDEAVLNTLAELQKVVH